MVDRKATPGLPPEGGPKFGFTYLNELGNSLGELRRTDPKRLPSVLADIVINSPIDESGWLARGVRPGYAENVYHGAALLAFAHAAHSPEITTEFLTALDAQAETVNAKVDEKLAAIIPVRVINTDDAVPQAMAEIAAWSVRRLPPDFDQSQIVGQSFDKLWKCSSDVLQQIADELRNREVTKLAIAISLLPEQKRRQEEREREAAVLRATEEETRLASLRVEREMLDNPGPVLSQLLARNDIVAVGDIENINPQQLLELVRFAARVEGQSLHNNFSGSDELVAFADAIMSRASALRRSGAIGSDTRVEYDIQSHDELPVIQATSEDSFWNNLARFAEWYEMTPRSVSDLYSTWRGNFIRRNKDERTIRVLEQAGISPETALPESSTGIDVRVESGAIKYETIDELIADMRRYFIPRMERFDPSIPGKGAIDNAVGNSVSTSLLSEIAKHSGGDAAIMKRLEQEIRQWAAGKAKDPYRDSLDNGGGDPYKYSSGLFTGHGIGAYKDKSNKYHLTLQGRGYNYYEKNPTLQVEDFAAYVGKDVDYSGGVSVTYVAVPPEDPQIQPGTGDEKPTVNVRANVRDFADHFGSLVGLAPKETQKLVRAAVTEPDRDGFTDPVFLKKDGLEFATSRYERLRRGRFDEASGAYTETGNVYEERDRQYFFLPKMGVKVTGGDQRDINRLAHLFKAIQAGAGSVLSYPNGYISPGHWSFSLSES